MQESRGAIQNGTPGSTRDEDQQRGLGLVTRRRAIITALLLALGARAEAQEAAPLGFTIGPQLLVEHDTNFFRTSGTEVVSIPGSLQTETVKVPVEAMTMEEADLVGMLHEVYGPETITASATGGRAHFDENSHYDYTDESLRADLQSDYPKNVTMKLGLGRTVALAKFEDIGNYVRDVMANNEMDASLAVPLLHVDWQGIVAGSETRTTNSAVVYKTLDLDMKELDAGIRYQPSSSNHVDLLARDALGAYPNGSPSVYVSPRFRDRGVDLRVDVTFSGISHVLGSAGYLQERNAQLDVYQTEIVNGIPTEVATKINRNFSGANFNLTYIRQLTGAFKVTAYGLRQIGPAGDYNYLSAVSHTYRIMPGYQPREKLEFDAYAEWTERNYFSDYAFLTGSEPGTVRLDVSRNAGLKMRWSLRRWLEINMSLVHEKRDSNIAVWSFVDNVATASVKAMFY